MNDPPDRFDQIEARIAKLERWPGRLLDWAPYLAVAAFFVVVMAVIIAVPSRRDRLELRFDTIESSLARIERKLETLP